MTTLQDPPAARATTGRLRDGVRAELLSLRATPSVRLLAGIALLASLAGLVVALAMEPVGSPDDVRSLLSFAGMGGLVVILLGVVVAAGEYRHRTIVPRTLADPGRSVSFVSQVVGLAVAGLLIGLVASALITSVTVIGLAATGAGPPVTLGDAGSAAVGSMVYAMAAAVAGGAIGSLARNQVAAAIVVFLYLSMVDPLVAMAVSGYGKFGPMVLGIAVTGGAPDPSGGPGAVLLPPVAAGAVWCGYAAALTVVAWLATRRRELP